MVKKYKLVRVYAEDIPLLKAKGLRMERTVKAYTGKIKRIPLTKVIHFVANNPTEIHEHQIIKLVKKRPVRKVRL